MVSAAVRPRPNRCTTRAGAASPFKYKPQFGVIVICESEPDQKKKFALLKKQGLKLKVVSV